MMTRPEHVFRSPRKNGDFRERGGIGRPPGPIVTTGSLSTRPSSLLPSPPQDHQLFLGSLLIGRIG